MAMHRDAFTVDVPESLSEEFDKLCQAYDLTKWKATAAALKAYLSLGERVQHYLYRTSTTLGDSQRLFAKLLPSLEEHLQTLSGNEAVEDESAAARDASVQKRKQSRRKPGASA